MYLSPFSRFIYPALGVGGNNAVLLEPDGYTKLFDELGGSIPGNVNPFKAYFKDQPSRVWSSTEATSEIQRWDMDIAGFGGFMQFKLVVDVSTNYPAASQPVIDNAPEPVAINATAGEGLTPEGGSAEIIATILDWQGLEGIGGVFVEAPDLFDGTVNLDYSGPGPNPDEYCASGTITNAKLASEGEYNYLVGTFDQQTGIYLYDEFIIGVNATEPTGNLIWAKSIGTTSVGRGKAITTLSDNSTIVIGHFYGTATFGEGDPNETILISKAGRKDIFIARYNPDGTIAWAKRAGGESEEECSSITTLSDSSTVITGFFKGTAIFGEGESGETTLISNEAFDIFIARYNPDGTLAWAKSAGGPGFCYATGITVLSDNSTVVTGYIDDSTTFGQGEPGETIVVCNGLYDSFIAQYNPDGTLAWAKSAATGGNLIQSRAISARSDNSTSISGRFFTTALFGSGQPNETTLTTAGSSDIFIAGYNPDGSFAWAKSAGGSSVDEGLGITTLSDNSSVITGFYHYTATFGKGEPNETILEGGSGTGVAIFIARYNPDGSFLWVNDALGDKRFSANAITALADDSVVITGDFSSFVVFDLWEPNQKTLNCFGTWDIFIARFDSDGNYEWAKQAGGEGQDESSGITTLSDNSSIVTGVFQPPATFGPGELGETVLTSTGWADIFIARYAP